MFTKTKKENAEITWCLLLRILTKTNRTRPLLSYLSLQLSSGYATRFLWIWQIHNGTITFDWKIYYNNGIKDWFHLVMIGKYYIYTLSITFFLQCDVSSQTKHQTHAKAHGNLTLNREKAHGWDWNERIS